MSPSDIDTLSQHALEARLLRALLAVYAARHGAQPDHAWLLWHLDAPHQAQAAFAAGDRAESVLPLLMLADLPAEQVLEEAIAVLPEIREEARPDISRAIFVWLWMQNDRADLAHAFALRALAIDPRLDVWPVTSNIYDGLEKLEQALDRAWTLALTRGDWQVARRIALLAAFADVELPVLAPEEGIPLDLLLWFVDHPPLETIASSGDLSAHLGEALAALMQGLGNDGETTALRIAAGDLVERQDPSRAAAHFRRIANAGADQLAAYLRLRTQRAAVAADRYDVATEEAANRLELAVEPQVIVGLSVVGLMYGLRSKRSLADLEQRARQLLRTARESHASLPPEMASGMDVFLGIAEALTSAKAARIGTSGLYAELEAAGDSLASRRFEVIHLAQENTPEALKLLLDDAAQHTPWRFPVAYALAHDTVRDSAVRDALSAWRESEDERPYDGLLLLQDFLGLTTGTSKGELLAVAGGILGDVAVVISGNPEDPERAKLLREWGERPELQLAGTAHLLRAYDAMSRGDKDQATDALIEAAAALGPTSDVEGMARKLERLSGDHTILDLILSCADDARFQRRLGAEPLLQAAWNDAERLTRESKWVAAAARLEVSANEADDNWLSGMLLKTATEWLVEHGGTPEESLRCSRRAIKHLQRDGELVAMHARLLSQAGEYAELRQLVDLHGESLARNWTDGNTEDLVNAKAAIDEPALSALFGLVATLLDRGLGGVAAATLMEYTTGLLVQHHRDVDAVALLDGWRSRIDGLAVSQFETLEKRLEARMRAGSGFMASIEDSERREDVVSSTIEQAAADGTWDELVDRLIAASEGTTDPIAKSEVLVVAASIMVNRGAIGHGKRILDRVEPATLTYDGLAAVIELAADTESWALESECLERAIEESDLARDRSRWRARLADVYDGPLESPGRAQNLRVQAYLDDPTNTTLFRQIEKTLSEKSDAMTLVAVYERAIETMHEVIGLDLDLETLYGRKGELEFYSLEALEDAAESFLGALGENPHEERYLGLIQTIAEQLKQPRLYGSALEVRVAGMDEGDPQRVDALLALAEVATDPAHKQELLQAVLATGSDRPDVVDRLEAIAAESGDPNARIALTELRLARANTSELPALTRELATLHEEAGTPEAAAEAWQSLLARAPDHEEALDRLSAIYEDLGDGTALLQILHQAFQAATSHEQRANTLRRLGFVYRDHLDDLAQAQHSLQRSLALIPAPETLEALRDVLMQRRDWSALADTLEQLNEVLEDPDRRIAALRELAEVCMTRLGDFPRAEVALRHATALDPNRPALTGTLLGLLIAQRSWSRAAELAENLDAGSTVAAHLGLANFSWMKGAIARAQGRRGAAIAQFVTGLREEPTHRNALAGLLATKPEPGSDADRFLSELTVLLDDAGKNDAVAEIARYRAHRLAALGRLADALDESHRARRAAPLRVDVFETRCDLLEKLGHYSDAVVLAEDTAHQARTGSRTWRRAAARAGKIYLDLLDDKDAARTWFETMRKQLPSDLEVQFWLAQACVASMDYEAAQKHLERVVSAYDGAQPSQMPARTKRAAAEHHFYLAQVLDVQGAHDKAAEHYGLSRSFWRQFTPAILGSLRNHWKRGAWSQLDTEIARAVVDLEAVHDTDALLRLRRLEASARAERDPLRAIAALETAIAAAAGSPERAGARAQLAQILRERGRDAEALRVTRAGLLESPLDAELLEAALVHAVGSERWDSAQRVAEAVGHFQIELTEAGQVAVETLSSRGSRMPRWPDDLNRFLPAELRRGVGAGLRAASVELQAEVYAAKLQPLRGGTASETVENAVQGLATALAGVVPIKTRVMALDLELDDCRVHVRSEEPMEVDIEIGSRDAERARVMLVRTLARLALNLEPLFSLDDETLLPWVEWIDDMTPSLFPDAPRRLRQVTAAQIAEASAGRKSKAEPMEQLQALRRAAVEAVDRVAVETVGVTPTLDWLAASRGQQLLVRDAVWGSADERVRRLVAFHLGRR